MARIPLRLGPGECSDAETGARFYAALSFPGAHDETRRDNLASAMSAQAIVTPADVAAAVHTLESGEVAGHGSANLGPAEWLFHPIRSQSSVLAAMGLSRDDGSKAIAEEQEPLLESLLDQTALALTRARDSEPPRRRAAAAR